MKETIWIGMITACAMILISCGSNPTSAQQPITVTMRNPYGGIVGNAVLTADPAGGVHMSIQVASLAPGKHGIHIHISGKCEGFDFASAGAHFNPDSKQHGAQNPQGAHAGDLPNLVVAADGTGTYEHTNKVVSFGAGPNSLFKPDGTALVIHANEDDEKTDPTGNSGGRISCGVLVR